MMATFSMAACSRCGREDSARSTVCWKASSSVSAASAQVGEVAVAVRAPRELAKACVGLARMRRGRLDARAMRERQVVAWIDDIDLRVGGHAARPQHQDG